MTSNAIIGLDQNTALNAAIAARDKRLADIAALAAQRSASGGVNAARMRKIEAIAKGDTP